MSVNDRMVRSKELRKCINCKKTVYQNDLRASGRGAWTHIEGRNGYYCDSKKAKPCRFRWKRLFPMKVNECRHCGGVIVRHKATKYHYMGFWAFVFYQLFTDKEPWQHLLRDDTHMVQCERVYAEPEPYPEEALELASSLLAPA